MRKLLNDNNVDVRIDAGELIAHIFEMGPGIMTRTLIHNVGILKT